MKKIKALFYCGILLAASLTACKFGNNKSNKKTSTNSETSSESSSETPTESKANDIITYTNAVVDLCNEYNDNIKRVDDYLSRAEKGLRKPDDRFAFIGLIKPFTTPSFSRDKVDVTKPASALEKNDQEFFKVHCTDIVNYKTSLYKRIDSLEAYINAQDYKDDKSVKGLTLIQNAYADYDTIQGLRHMLYDRVDVVAEESEKVLLEKDPLKDNYMAMKQDMKLVDNFAKLFGTNADHLAGVIPKIEEMYKQMETACNTHKTINADALGKTENASRKNAYESFYKDFEESLGLYRRIIRDSKGKGKISESDLSSLYRKSDDLIKDYNRFAH